MIDTHRLAPMLRAARPMALLAAQGLLTAQEALAALAAAAESAAVQCNFSGARTALAWALNDQITEAQLARARHRWVVVDAIAPLLAARPRVAAAAIIAEARAAGRPLLLPRECTSIAEAEMARALRDSHGK
jgi:hypothetical protein